MTFSTIRLSAASDTSGPSLNVGMASGEFSAMYLSPLVVLMGVCLIGLLVLGILWLKGRYQNYEFHRLRPTEHPTGLSSTYDYVTGLPTRRLFGTLLEQAIRHAEKTGRLLALLVVELDHFRVVTEHQGQANGNVVVRVQAARVKGVLGSTETVARLAPDQFAMILDHLTSLQEVTTIVDTLQATVGLPLTLDGQELFLTCRVGVALYPQDAMDCEGLIAQAMRAVKQAKFEGQAVQFTSSIAFSAAEPMPVASKQAV